MKKNLRDRIDRYKKISAAIKAVPNAVAVVVDNNKDVLLSLNRDQMLLGRNAVGETLTPTYQQDPYFKSSEAADRYARMKYALETSHSMLLWSNAQVYPDKSKDTPNLIVTGKFQNGMFITTSTNGFTIGSTFSEAGDIDQKYNGVFGVAPKSVDFFWTYYLRQELIKHLGI